MIRAVRRDGALLQELLSVVLVSEVAVDCAFGDSAMTHDFKRRQFRGEGRFASGSGPGFSGFCG